MALEIYWSKKADKNFDSITDYLIVEFGKNSAKKFASKVYEMLAMLQEFLEIGSVENTKLNIRGILIAKQVTMFYTIRNTKLIIFNFYDNRQNPEKKKY